MSRADTRRTKRRVVVTLLCGLMIVDWGRSLFGIVNLSIYQGVSWDLNILSERTKVPMIAVIIESLLLLGAAAIPLLTAWRSKFAAKRWLLYVWLLCITYPIFVGVNFILRASYATHPWIGALARLIAWIAIGAFFIRDLRGNRSRTSLQTQR